jgi:DNA-binding CsgD family transcriptional regulator
MTDPNSPKHLIRLTRRQKQCLRLLAEGKTARASAHELGISVRMVRMHLQSARLRLKAASGAQAVYIASKDGLLD